jgi:hypothetical protein
MILGRVGGTKAELPGDFSPGGRETGCLRKISNELQYFRLTRGQFVHASSIDCNYIQPTGTCKRVGLRPGIELATDPLNTRSNGVLRVAYNEIRIDARLPDAAGKNAFPCRLLHALNPCTRLKQRHRNGA